MSERPDLVLHIGTMKSGTTYLQHGLLSKQAQLNQIGWLYPMAFAPARGAINHERACYGIVGNEIPWVDQAMQQKMLPQWQALLAEISQSNKSVLLSAEALAAMLESGIEKLISALPQRNLKVVITARDLARVLPSSWQQSVRNGRTFGYQEYFERIEQAARNQIDEAVGSNFWRSYRISDVISRWRKFVPLENIKLVVVPPKGSADSLWQRFIKASEIDLVGSDPVFNDNQSHAAITWPEAEVLVELNRRWSKANRTTKWQNQMRRRIVQEGFANRTDRGRQIGLTQSWLELATNWAAADVAKLAEISPMVIGDLTELLVSPSFTPAIPCTESEIAQAQAIADRFHDNQQIKLLTKLFGINRKRLR